MAHLSIKHTLEDDCRQQQQHDSFEQPQHQQQYNITQWNRNQLKKQQQKVAHEEAFQQDVKQMGIDQQGIEQQGFVQEHAQQQSHTHKHLPQGKFFKYLCKFTILSFLYLSGLF